MKSHDREYFNNCIAILSEQVRLISSMCDDVQHRLDEMTFILEDIRVDSALPPVPNNWLTYTEPEDKCDCEYCACAAYAPDYRMD